MSKYPLEFLRYKIEIVNSAIIDANVAPALANLGINIKFKIKLTIAPMIIYIALCFLNPAGV